MAEKMGRYAEYRQANRVEMADAGKRFTGTMAGRNEYKIPDAIKVREEKMRTAMVGKPPEQKFLTDMEA